MEQSPAWGSHRFVALRIRRERLTGSATGKDSNVRRAEQFFDVGRRQRIHISLDELSIVVLLEGMPAVRVDVDPRDNVDACRLETMREAANATEQIDAINGQLMLSLFMASRLIYPHV